MKLIPKLCIVTVITSMISCSNNSTDDLTDTDMDISAVTYTNDIKTIIDNNCVICHGDPLDNGAPFPMTNYTELVEAAKTRGVLSRMTSASNPMPPSGLLPSTATDLVKKWIEDDFPE